MKEFAFFFTLLPSFGLSCGLFRGFFEAAFGGGGDVFIGGGRFAPGGEGDFTFANLASAFNEQS